MWRPRRRSSSTVEPPVSIRESMGQHSTSRWYLQHAWSTAYMAAIQCQHIARRADLQKALTGGEDCSEASVPLSGRRGLWLALRLSVCKQRRRTSFRLSSSAVRAAPLWCKAASASAFPERVGENCTDDTTPLCEDLDDPAELDCIASEHTSVGLSFMREKRAANVLASWQARGSRFFGVRGNLGSRCKHVASPLS